MADECVVRKVCSAHAEMIPTGETEGTQTASLLRTRGDDPGNGYNTIEVM